MRVVSPVINDKGMVLLPADSEITESILERLKKWGVQSVNVNTDGSALHAASFLSQEQLQEKITRIKGKFAPHHSDPLMNDICENLIKYYHTLAEPPTSPGNKS